MIFGQMDIWEKCRNYISPETIGNQLIRVVESQEQIATNSLVESFEEQAALEHMLEKTKPAMPVATNNIDYLLTTPFRYPPLKYGSRFGTHQEPSLFYGSLSLPTAFAEVGYYRFLFWRGMSETPTSGKFITQHTVFGVEYKTSNGFKLQNAPFSDYEKMLIDPANYSATHRLGAEMRKANIDAFEYRSARDLDHGLNVALFNSTALASTKPLYKEQWLCDANENTVTFYSSNSVKHIYKFPLQGFMVGDKFPAPAV